MAKVNLSVREFETLIKESVRSAVYSALEKQRYREIDQNEWRNLIRINTLYSRQLDAIRTRAKYHMDCVCDKDKCEKCKILNILAREE